MIDSAGYLERAEELLEERKLFKSKEVFDTAERLGADPDRCSGGRWMSAMLLGHFEGAWRESDAIRIRGAPDPHRFWNGEDLRGKRLIVRCLHGFGDAVQMLRYMPRLRDVAARVVVQVPPKFVELARFFDGVNAVNTWGNDGGEWDVQLEVMELPYIFRTWLGELPLAVRYVHVPEVEVRRVADAMRCSCGESGLLRVGVVWAGGEWNPERTLPFGELQELLVEGGVEFWNLQGRPAAVEAEGSSMRDATEVCGDGLVPLAATIANLDLVITVDTLAAHLAGAMGRPAWVMLQRVADWRWMVERSDSPWYPTLRLFRQAEQGDWAGLVKQVRCELVDFARGTRWA